MADEQLQKIAREAWQRWPNPDDGNARSDYVASQLKDDLLWTAMEMFDRTMLNKVVGALLNDTKPTA